MSSSVPLPLDAAVMDRMLSVHGSGVWRRLFQQRPGHGSAPLQRAGQLPGDFNGNGYLGGTSSQTQTVQVLPLPMAQFGYDQPACFGNSVLFDDYSTTEEGYITTWHYAFGDGCGYDRQPPGKPERHPRLCHAGMMKRR
ncbi:MAG: hypothetical protein U5L09_07185 [Bacteroidales bacterium]|nr:hypothetical protein [Bacteroidales bacterium]